MLAEPGHCARHCAGYCARQARDRLHGPVVAQGDRLLGLGSHLVLPGEVRALEQTYIKKRKVLYFVFSNKEKTSK
jgi:hypothetical protein